MLIVVIFITIGRRPMHLSRDRQRLEAAERAANAPAATETVKKSP